MDLEDRYKLLFCWIWKISLDSSRDGNIFGWVWKIWMALSGFDWIWADLVGFGWVWTSNFEWICLDLVGYKRI